MTFVAAGQDTPSPLASVRFGLANGLRVVVVPMPGVRSVTAAIFIGLGSRYEPDRDAGAAHLIEHMLFKGTQRRPDASIISDTIEALGGVLNASTDKELTVVWAKVAGEHLPVALDLLSDMVRNSRISPGDIRREKKVVTEELKMLADDPQDWVHALLDEALWPRHAVGREVAGTMESVQSLRGQTLGRYLHAFYGANNAVVALAGGIDPTAVGGLVQRHLGDWPEVTPWNAQAWVGRESAGRVRLERRASEQVNMCLGFPGVPNDHPDFAAINVLAHLLGGGTSSRLFVQLREKLALAYDVHAYTTHLSDTGSFVIYAATGAAGANRALEAIMAEINRLQRRKVADVELQRVKQSYRGRLWLSLEDTYAVAGWFGFQEILDRPDLTPEAAVVEIDGVSSGDLVRVARRYLAPERAVLAAVGNVEHLNMRLLGPAAG